MRTRTAEQIDLLRRCGRLDEWHRAIEQDDREARAERGESVPVARAPEPPAPQPPAAPAKDHLVTRGLLRGVMERTGKAVRDAINKRVATASDDLGRRMSAIENRVGALSLMLARGPEGGKQLRQLEELFERLDEQARRIKELEHQPQLHYEGVWESERQFNRGAIVTHGGSAWHANKASHGARPGESDAWTLMVKRGRDAR